MNGIYNGKVQSLMTFSYEPGNGKHYSVAVSVLEKRGGDKFPRFVKFRIAVSHRKVDSDEIEGWDNGTYCHLFIDEKIGRCVMLDHLESGLELDRIDAIPILVLLEGLGLSVLWEDWKLSPIEMEAKKTAMEQRRLYCDDNVIDIMGGHHAKSIH